MRWIVVGSWANFLINVVLEKCNKLGRLMYVHISIGMSGTYVLVVIISAVNKKNNRRKLRNVRQSETHEIPCPYHRRQQRQRTMGRRRLRLATAARTCGLPRQDPRHTRQLGL